MARNQSLKGKVFASAGTTSIPQNPLTGVTYRNSNITKAMVASGWPFNQVVDSATFNQIMYEIMALLNEIERNGGIEYSENTDYVAGNVCRYDAGDGNVGFYVAVAPSGPSSSPVQPGSDESYWTLVTIENGGGSGGGGTGSFKRPVTVSSASAVTVKIGDAVICTPSGNLSIGASPEDGYAGYADCYVTVPAGATVTAGTNSVFADNQTVVAGKVNHIRIDFESLETARLYVIDSWGSSGGGSDTDYIAPDQTLFYKYFIHNGKLAKMTSGSAWSYIDNEATGWRLIGGEEADVTVDAVLGVKNNKLYLVDSDVVKIMSSATRWSGFASCNNANNKYAHAVENGAVKLITPTGSSKVTAMDGSSSDAYTCVSGTGSWGLGIKNGKLMYLAGYNYGQIGSQSGWTACSSYAVSGRLGYGIRSGYLYRISRDTSYHATQVGSSSQWTAISGFSSDSAGGQALGICNGALYLLTETTQNQVTGSGYTKISGMCLGTAIKGYAIDGNGALWMISNTGARTAVDSGSTGWTDIRGGYDPQNGRYAIALKGAAAYLLDGASATLIA